MTEIPPSGSQPALATWSRVARRIRVPLSFAFAVGYVCLAQPTRTSLLAGGLVLVPGLLLRALASGHVQKDRELTTSGPYAYTRNPLYLGSLILAAGFALAARSAWILGLLVLMFVAIYVPVIAGEERYLRQTFPEYGDYARHVPRFWLRLTPFGNRQGTFSSALYWKHREYNAILGCVAVLAVLVVKLVW
jgi:protein-S-isoprenylcysteine O-methyltransferase Ste14